ncbi:trace amine-associated receptor 4-like [Trachinotus anak]|uniref:trace amine-associated receptor 4-like n=1 Tax=Trachinotus anak TaxID=443729 RepID=UPI0039F17ED2
MMAETLGGDYLCTPALNSSCRLMSVTPDAILIKTLMYCLSLLTVMLNLLVIISISHFRQLHTPTNLLILSLAVSDFLLGLVVMPPSVILLQSCWFLDKITCALLFLASFILTSASVGTMVLISVDRYVAICEPLHYCSMMTAIRVKICVSVCWFCSVTYNLIIMKDFLSQIDLSDPCYQECSLTIDYISGAVDLILTFSGPVAVIIVLYMRVFVAAVSQARAMKSQIAKSKTVSVKKSEMRAARTLGIVLLVFILCLCPYYIPSLAGQETTGPESPATIWLFYCNSSFNPLIYAFYYPWFRKTVKLIVSLQILRPGSCETKIM